MYIYIYIYIYIYLIISKHLFEVNYRKTQVSFATGIYFIFKKRWSSQNFSDSLRLLKYS